MRQIGFLAGCITYALNHNFLQLPRVHVLARRLEVGLREAGVCVLGAGTCIVCLGLPSLGPSSLLSAIQVFFDPTPLGIECDELSKRAAMLPEPITITDSRLVVHIQTEDQAVDDLLTLIKVITGEKKAAGFVEPPPAEGKWLVTENVYQEIDRRFKPQSQ